MHIWAYGPLGILKEFKELSVSPKLEEQFISDFDRILWYKTYGSYSLNDFYLKALQTAVQLQFELQLLL